MNGITRAALVYLTCVNLVAMPVARAETTSWDTGGTGGQGGSITIGTMDPDRMDNHPISDKFHYGDRARLVINARDRLGNPVSCTPTFTILNDYGGTQIAGVDPGTGIMTMGNSLGEPRLRVTCAELPGIVGELHVYNMKKMVPPKFGKPGKPPLMQPLPNPLLAPVPQTAAQAYSAPPAADAAADAAAASAAADVGGTILLAGAVVGGTYLLLGAVGGGSQDCSTRNCIGSFSCQCVGSTQDTCTSSDEVAALGESCFGGSGSSAYCEAGLTCFNGSCRTNCPL